MDEAIVLLLVLFYLGILAIYVVAGWKIYVKANQPGWASLVPIYNMVVLLEIVGRPTLWILFLLIPIVNIVFGIILCVDLAKSFGKDALFGIGLAFLSFIFYPMLAFGDATYTGPSAKGA